MENFEDDNVENTYSDEEESNYNDNDVYDGFEEEENDEYQEEPDTVEEENDENDYNENIEIMGGAKHNEEDEDDDEDEDEDEDDDKYLQKFNEEINKNYIHEFHPECLLNNNDEVNAFTTIVRDSQNNIIDDLHKTLPYLTKYEYTRVLGQRAKQINSGAKPFIDVPENIMDGYLIAEMELKEKKIPFVICRPLGNKKEFWKLKDLEIIRF